jgi:Tetratricopeptide repeat
MLLNKYLFLHTAEELQLEVLDQRRKTLGLEHLDTIAAAANLAATYWDQGRHGEAEKLELERRRRILGPEHPDTILAAANLAAAYGRQTRWVRCLDLLAPAVELSMKVLGNRHPDTQDRIKRLANVYEKLGKQQEAEETRKMLIS